jgi:hypothetical protein
MKLTDHTLETSVIDYLILIDVLLGTFSKRIMEFQRHISYNLINLSMSFTISTVLSVRAHISNGSSLPISKLKYRPSETSE